MLYCREFKLKVQQAIILFFLLFFKFTVERIIFLFLFVLSFFLGYITVGILDFSSQYLIHFQKEKLQNNVLTKSSSNLHSVCLVFFFFLSFSDSQQFINIPGSSSFLLGSSCFQQSFQKFKFYKFLKRRFIFKVVLFF